MNFAGRANGYARRVVAGDIPACRLHRLACERQLRDLKRAGRGWTYRFDDGAANRICQFIELLPHIKGEWARPQFIDGAMQYPKIKLEDWQCFVLCVVFGWVNNETGRRRFTRVYEEVPRKNAKSTKVAGIGLYMMTADGEPGAECYSVATTGEQSRIVWGDAAKMAEREPEFRAMFCVDIHAHDVSVPGTASIFRPLNAEGSTLDGLNIHFGAIDEFHAHKRRNLFDVIDSATGARSQPLIWMVTTAGSDRSGICYEQRTHLVKILDGVVEDETFFGLICSIDDGDDWSDPAIWAKANPNYGVSVLAEDMEQACRKAMSMPSAVNNFLTKRLNVWVNADSAWMDMKAWEACADRTLTVDQVEHLPCWMALDLASKVDIAAKVKLFVDHENNRYYLFADYYLPERAVENSANSQYQGWRRSGLLRATEGEITDFDVIEQDIIADCGRFDVREVPYDPFQATQLATHMIENHVPMVEMRPTVLNFSEPMKQLEALVLSGKLVHDGNPITTWMISNVVAHLDAKDNIYPRKERPENKIDGVVATIMALGRVYQERGASKQEIDAYFSEGMRAF
ncbi:MAG: terminase large subunit [Burkholderiales bacterium]|jgi:phage terminase large subunit-like protein|nr:terminase large subunit [Burkholderiales bacterium]